MFFIINALRNIFITDVVYFQKMVAQRWTNIAFTWSPTAEAKLFADGQVVAIMSTGVDVTPSAPAGQKETIIVGHPDNKNNTFIDIFNVAIWESYYYSSKAYELTGHSGKHLLR